MATFSTFLNLKLNDPSDPFQLSDFVNNWQILDGSPGVFVCTSGSKPSWGTAQAGRTIFLTDYRQFLWWNGTTWLDPEVAPPVLAGGVILNASLAKNTSPVNTVVTLTLSRPATLAIMLTGTYTCSNQLSQFVSQRITLDGNDQLMGGFSDQLDFIGNAGDAAGTVGCTIPSVAVGANVATGSHTIGVRSIIGQSNTVVTLRGAKVLAFVTSYNSSNSM